MIDLKDPDMKEIVDEFCQEAFDLIEELNSILEEFEDNPSDKTLLEKYGQTVDRIMGAAKTLGLDEVGHLAQMGKILGYKSSQAENENLQEIAGGVLFDLCDLLEVIITNVKEGKDQNDHEFNMEAFKGRLQWLAGKLRHIERGSCAVPGEEKKPAKKSTTAELDRLINQFGKAS